MLKILLTKVLFTLKRKFVCYNFETKLYEIMKLQFLIATIAACVLLAGCTKDKYATKPKLELSSINGSEFTTGSVLSFKFTVTDKEGDINDTMWVQKVSFVCTETNSGWPGAYKVPDFATTKNLKVDLDVN